MLPSAYEWGNKKRDFKSWLKVPLFGFVIGKISKVKKIVSGLWRKCISNYRTLGTESLCFKTYFLGNAPLTPTYSAENQQRKRLQKKITLST